MTGARFKPYPEYKDSGIEWLGEIPAHWDVRRLKNVVDLRNEKMFSLDSEKPYIGMENVESWTGRIINTDLEVTGVSGTFMAGDVLFGKLRPYLAKAMLADTSGQCSSEFLVMKPKAVLGRFLHLLVLSKGFVRTVDSATYGTKMPRANWDTVGGIGISIPEVDEQYTIADFLDRETARIDALVEKKERLIELLKEKRTALITHAVTKGLDPNVPMKNSGIEWLGQIPAYWEALRLKHLLKAQKAALKTGPFGSQLQSSEMNGGAIKVYNQKNVISQDVSGGDNYISIAKFEDLRAFEVFEHDLLVTTRGTIGRCMIMSPGAERGILHPCLMRIQIEPSLVLNHYLEMLIQGSNQVLNQLRLMSNATTIDVIYSESLREVWLAVPPIQEQQTILDFLDRETAKIDTLISKIQEAIARLKEYRTALISAAVTGKIDVRNQEIFEAVTES